MGGLRMGVRDQVERQYIVAGKRDRFFNLFFVGCDWLSLRVCEKSAQTLV
jgi:hypothetical protein